MDEAIDWQQAYSDLESKIAEVLYMAHIACDQVEGVVGGDHSPITKNRDMKWIPEETADVVIFSVLHVQDLASKLHRAYHDRFEKVENAGAVAA